MSSSQQSIIHYNESPPLYTSNNKISLDISSTSPIQLFNGSFIWLKQLKFNLADNMEQCFDALNNAGLPITPNISSQTLPWCNATWDTVRIFLLLYLSINLFVIQ